MCYPGVGLDTGTVLSGIVMRLKCERMDELGIVVDYQQKNCDFSAGQRNMAQIAQPSGQGGAGAAKGTKPAEKGKDQKTGKEGTAEGGQPV
ncbi:MAG: hypothetical protein EZS28_043219, partial [Streblomastix strix]